MAGYNPASTVIDFRSGELVQRTSPFLAKSWWQRYRDRKANRRKAWMKFFAALVMQGEKLEQFFKFVDSTSTDDILCKAGKESWNK